MSEVQLDQTSEKESGSILQVIGRSLASWAQLRHTPYGLWPVLAITFLYLALVLGVGGSSLLLPNIAQDININIAQIASILSLVSLITLAASLGLGYLADRINRAKMLSVGAFITGLAGIFLGQAGSINTLATPLV